MSKDWAKIPALLAEFIKNYESDTFSASSCELTDNESKWLANFFLNRTARGGNINDKLEVDLFADKIVNLDGVNLSEVLEWLREGELKDSEIN